MKYFFLADECGKRHIIIAASEENARNLARGSGIAIDDLYELVEGTFTEEGFLISDR